MSDLSQGEDLAVQYGTPGDTFPLGTYGNPGVNQYIQQNGLSGYPGENGAQGAGGSTLPVSGPSESVPARTASGSPNPTNFTARGTALLQSEVIQGSDGVFYYHDGKGNWVSTGTTDPTAASNAIQTATGMPANAAMDFIQRAQYDYAQAGRQFNIDQTGKLIGANPDGSYSWIGPDGKVTSGTPQQAQAAGITPGEIEQASDEAAYRIYRSNEAKFQFSAFNPNPMNLTPPQGAQYPPPAVRPSPGVSPSGAPSPIPVGRGMPPQMSAMGYPSAPAQSAPQMMSTMSAPAPQAPQGMSTMASPYSLPNPYSPSYSTPSYASASGYSPPTMSAANNYGMNQTYGTPSGMPSGMPSGRSGGVPNMAPTYQTYDASGLPAGTTQQGASDYLSGLQTAYNIGQSRYDLANQAAQQNLTSLNTAYNTNDRNFQLSAGTYTGGLNRQQYSQNIQDLQNQYNMSQSRFQLGQQPTEQANTAFRNATQQNQNQQMSQNRTLSGMGYPTQGARITGLS